MPRDFTRQNAATKLIALLILSLIPAALAVDNSPSSPIDCSELAFEPKLWSEHHFGPMLVPWEGEHVVFLTKGSDFGPKVMDRFVSRLDAGWKLYADLIGQSPRLLKQVHGKPTIVAVENGLTCGYGCGYVGSTGIEVCGFYDNDYPRAIKSPDAFAHYYFYEMGRNYYVFGNRHSCFITGFAVFMRYVCMNALNCGDPESDLRKTIEGIEPRFAASKLSFLDLFTNTTFKNEKAGRIKDDHGRAIEPSDQPVCYASAMLRLRRENGGDAWVKRFFNYLATCPESDPGTESGALKQGLHWLICASLAAHEDLSPIFADDWHLPMTPQQRAAMAAIDWKQTGLTVAVVDETLGASPNARAADASAPCLVPQPKSVALHEGTLTWDQAARIVAADRELVPLANVLAGEIRETTGISLAVGELPPGQILLKLDPAFKGEAYALDIADAVTVRGGNYQSVASGTATLLQLLSKNAGRLVLPKLKIADEPRYSYRAALLDLGRKYHSPGGIEQVIKLCRLYKIRYLHLHLTDDQLFMFPSTKFPQLGKSNSEFARFEPGSKPHIEPYTLDELNSLERFAVERGVYLVPELDLPGHSGRLIADAPDIFGIPNNSSTVNIANAKTFEAITALLNEVMDVFQSTPYVHLGADEVGLNGLDVTPEYKAAAAQLGIASVHEMYCKFVTDLCEIVHKRGKRPIVWEEAWESNAKFSLPKDTLITIWELGRNPDDVVRSGYSVINAGWAPLYIVRSNKKSPEFLFNWSLPQFGREGSTHFARLKEAAGLAGAELCSWENSESIEIQSMRERLAIVAEHAWNPEAGGTFAEFESRHAHTDAMLDKLVNPITIETDAKFIGDENTFTEPFTLALSPKAADDSLTLKYTLDNKLPNETWRIYGGPIIINKTVHLRAGLFDSRGAQHGYLVGSWFRSEIRNKPNLATGKPVMVGPGPDRTDAWASKVAVDGNSDEANAHWASVDPAPQWLQVDLGKAQPINFINVITYWDGGRYYQFNGDVSVDGKTWTTVLDFSKNKKIATAEGYSGKFPDALARYVRINMLKNSANPFVHIVELIVDKR